MFVGWSITSLKLEAPEQNTTSWQFPTHKFYHFQNNEKIMLKYMENTGIWVMLWKKLTNNKFTAELEISLLRWFWDILFVQGKEMKKSYYYTDTVQKKKIHQQTNNCLKKSKNKIANKYIFRIRYAWL